MKMLDIAGCPAVTGIAAAELQVFHVALGQLHGEPPTLSAHILGRVLRPSPVEAEIRKPIDRFFVLFPDD